MAQGGCEAPASPELLVPVQIPSRWESWENRVFCSNSAITQKQEFLGLGAPRVVLSAYLPQALF